jgi:threonine dehydratase
VRLSPGHIEAATLSADDMKEISGANPDLMGQFIENYAESGKAIELRQAQGMKVVEVLFDNFARTQKLVAMGLVDMIRFTNVYSDDEIRAAAQFLLLRARLVVEFSGAAAVAALRSGRVQGAGRKIGAILSGGNIDPARLAELTHEVPL